MKPSIIGPMAWQEGASKRWTKVWAMLQVKKIHKDPPSP